MNQEKKSKLSLKNDFFLLEYGRTIPFERNVYSHIKGVTYLILKFKSLKKNNNNKRAIWTTRWRFSTFVLPNRNCSVSRSRCSKITLADFSGVIGGFSLFTHRIEYLCFVGFDLGFNKYYNKRKMETNKCDVKLHLMSN